MLLESKWSNKGLGSLEVGSIQDRYIRQNAAQLMENQTKDLGKSLFAESSTIGGSTNLGNAGVSMGTGNFGGVPTVSMALVRRVFPALFANKAVGVQAMNSPVGLAYALRFVYGDGSGVEAAWDKVPEYSGFTGSAIGASGTADAGTGVASSAAELWQLGELNGANGSTGQAMPEIQFKLDRVAFQAQTRKVGAAVSIDAIQDIMATQNIDIEKEIVNLLQYELQAELDRELLAKMKAVATDEGTFDVAVSGLTVKSEAFTLVANKALSLCNNIAIRTRRGAGNILIVSPRLATALQASGTIFARTTANVNASTAVAEIGTLNGNITVYRDQYATSDYMLAAYKGEGVSDAGIIFAPYVTAVQMRAVDSNDFSPRVAVQSRYAIVDNLLGSQRYFAKVAVTGISSLI